jgi:outer membrane immunogenic protein
MNTFAIALGIGTMKRVLTLTLGLFALSAVPALAADIPMKAPVAVPVMAPAFNWTGFYIGANGGYAFGGRDSVDIAETSNGAPFVAGTWPGFGNFRNLQLSGAFAGGQIGYNWQVNPNWVIGVEADLQGAGIRATQNVTLAYINAANAITVGSSSNVDWFGTARGRVGWAIDRWLVYATGGLAYGNSKYAVTMSDTLGFTANSNINTTRLGYVVGGGVEWAFTQNWTAKVEYQYINLGTYNVAAVEIVGGAASTFAIATQAHPDFHSVRLGINYLFNAGPVVARY